MTIKWILNSALLISGENGVSIIKLSPKTSVLNIPAVNERHRGVYKCIADNAAGQANFSSEFHVNGITYIIYYLVFLVFYCFKIISTLF